MSVQWDNPERAGPFIRILERESKAWRQAAEVIEGLMPAVAESRVAEAELRVRECKARAEALRKLVLHICEGDYSLLTDPES